MSILAKILEEKYGFYHKSLSFECKSCHFHWQSLVGGLCANCREKEQKKIDKPN